MRLGFAMIDTHGLSRIEALQQAGREAMPVAGAAIGLFALAGLIEAFLSPSAAPYSVKLAVAIVSTLLAAVLYSGSWSPAAGNRAGSADPCSLITPE